MQSIGYFWVAVGIALVVIGGYTATKAPAAGLVFGPVALYVTLGGLDMVTDGKR